MIVSRLFSGFLVFVLLAAAPLQAEDGKKKVIISGDNGGVRAIKYPDLDRVAELVIQRTNAFRESQNLKPVGENAQLEATAQYFADYMARTGNYGHHGDGRAPHERASAHGYEFNMVLENIANAHYSAGFSTEELTHLFVQGWEDSPGHRQNMLHPHAMETGVAIARSEQADTYYAVQMFGRPASWRIQFQLTNQTGTPLRCLVRNEGDASTEQTVEVPNRTTSTMKPGFPMEVHFPWMNDGQWRAVRDHERYTVYRDPAGGFAVRESVMAHR